MLGLGWQQLSAGASIATPAEPVLFQQLSLIATVSGVALAQKDL